MQLEDLQSRAINAIRFLSVDAVQKANSGHPGLPMGAAAMAFTLWTRHLKHNPADPQWVNRDRFILSGGHGSMLVYSLLHLCGYDLTLEDLKHFRQWDSKTPGHPEIGMTPGVETTTGPLGQGFANAVGMALAEAHLAAEFNRPGFELINHYTYGIVTDGDLMEGISSEAASFAGYLKLGKLIFLYDDNRISIEGSTDLAFTEDRGKRFEAFGWHVSKVDDGNNVEEIDRAIKAAQKDPRPSLILCRTHIGFGLPNLQDSEKCHGSPAGEKEIALAKQAVNWPLEPTFFIPEDVLAFYRQQLKKGSSDQQNWNQLLDQYRVAYPDLTNEFLRRNQAILPEDLLNKIPSFPADEKGIATRAASGKVINAIAPFMPELIGGSADLAPSTNTWIQSSSAIGPDSKLGNNIHFGIREHAMGSITNGMNLHKGLRAYAATFFVFSDYMKPSLRIAALSKIPSIWVFTHDSIGVGEDGPTHQPIEHLASMRAIPDMVTIRPADANEVSAAWKVALKRTEGPTALILSRQAVPVQDRSALGHERLLEKGAYVLADLGPEKPEILLLASGTEVSLILEAGKVLAQEGISVRIISFPSWELFKQQSVEYRESVLPVNVPLRLAVEAGVSMGWERWIGPAGQIISMDHFGASAPANILFETFGFTSKNIVKMAKNMLGLNL